MAVEALDTTLSRGEPRVTAAEQALRDALLVVGGKQFLGNNAVGDRLGMSADGRWLLTLDSETAIARLWDLTATDPSTKEIVLSGQGGISCGEFSSDSKFLSTGGSDGTICVWDLPITDPKVPRIALRGSEPPIGTLRISPDSHRLAAAMFKSVQLWDLTDPSQPSTPRVLGRDLDTGLRIITISPDSRWLAAVTTTGPSPSVHMWDLKETDFSTTEPVILGHTRQVAAIAFTPDGHRLATADSEAMLQLWDLTAPEPTSTAIATGDWKGLIDRLAISSSGQWLAAGDSEGRVVVWDLTAADIPASARDFRGHHRSISGITFSRDNRWFVTASASGDATARVWDMTARDPSAIAVVLRGHDGGALSPSISPDGQTLITTGYDRRPRKWKLGSPDASTSGLVLRGYAGPDAAMTVSPDGHWLAATSSDGAARTWDLTASDPASTAKVLPPYAGKLSRIANIAGDNHWLIANCDGPGICLWDLRQPDRQAIITPGVLSTSFIWRTDVPGLVAEMADHTNLRLNLATDDPSTAPIQLGKRVGGLMCSSDGHWLVTGSEEGPAILTDLTVQSSTARRIRLTASDPKMTLVPVAMSPDSHWLVTSYVALNGEPVNPWTMSLDLAVTLNDEPDGLETSALVWDLTAPDPSTDPALLHFPRHCITCIAFTEDSRRLIAGVTDGQARVWDLSTTDRFVRATILREYVSRKSSWPNLFSPRSISRVSRNSRWYVKVGDYPPTAFSLWDLAARDEVKQPIELKKHPEVGDWAISQDSHWLAISESGGANVHLWDLTAVNLSASEIILRGVEASPWIGFAFTPDCRQLVTCGNHVAQVWKLDLNELMAQARETAGRELTPEERQQYSLLTPEESARSED